LPLRHCGPAQRFGTDISPDDHKACSSFRWARQFATAHGLIPPSPRFASILDRLTLERLLMAGTAIVLIGIAGFVWCMDQWASVGFGPLQYANVMRVLIISLTAIAIGFQLALAGFLLAITAITTR
jgi:hypothetical protein